MKAMLRAQMSREENTTHPNMIRSGVHTLVTNCLQVLGVLAGSILIARLAGPEGKGAVDLCVATGLLMKLLVGFSLPMGITYFTAQGKVNINRLIRSLKFLSMVKGIIAAAILLFLFESRWAAVFLPSFLGLGAVGLVSLNVMIDIRRLNWRAILVGQREFISANQSDLVKQLLLLIFLCALFAALMWSRTEPQNLVVLIIISIILSGSVASIVGCHFIRIPKTEFVTKNSLKDVVLFALPGQLGNIVQFVNYRFTAFVLNSSAGLSGLGIFMTAVMIGEVLRLLPAAVAGILFPSVAAGIRTDKISENTCLVARLVL
jgi:O-antigen/teichoic acid export membrane protein